MRICYSFTLGLALLLSMLTAVSAAEGPMSNDAFTQSVEQLVMDLGADSEATRNEARDELLELAGPTSAAGERMLAALPESLSDMPPAIRNALVSIRKTIAERVATLSVSASRVTIDVVQQPLSEVLALIEQQTGNQIKDLRDQFGQQAVDRPVTISLEDAPFWEAIDQVLDEAGLAVYAYSGERALTIVARESGSSPRWSAAAYAGPLRIEPVRITATRNLRQTSGESLNVRLEVSWEPRITPIALSQPLAEVIAENENGARLSMARPEQTLNIETQSGAQTAELILPMLLPTRETTLIASLRGKLQAIVPGRRVEFRFDQLSEVDEPISQQEGGATVTLLDVRKNNEIWELHMRLRLTGADGEGDQDAFASHRGWVFNNLTYLEDADGQVIDHAGFETTMQRGNEIGLAYLFNLPEGPVGLTWVYKTPTAIIRFPVEYELNHIPLP